MIIKSDEKNRHKWKIGIAEKVIGGIDGVVYTGRENTNRTSVLERVVLHLFPPCDKTEQAIPAKLNTRAPEFQPRPKRQAAVEARE